MSTVAIDLLIQLRFLEEAIVARRDHAARRVYLGGGKDSRRRVTLTGTQEKEGGEKKTKGEWCGHDSRGYGWKWKGKYIGLFSDSYRYFLCLLVCLLSFFSLPFFLPFFPSLLIRIM